MRFCYDTGGEANTLVVRDICCGADKTRVTIWVAVIIKVLAPRDRGCNWPVAPEACRRKPYMLSLHHTFRDANVFLCDLRLSLVIRAPKMKTASFSETLVSTYATSSVVVSSTSQAVD